MKAQLEATADAAGTVESLRLELDESRLRMGELEQTEELLVGENRLLEMVSEG